MTNKPSPGVAALASFYGIGLGHIYAGRWARGLTIMFGYPCCAAAYVISVLRWCNLGAPEGTGGRWFLGLAALGIVVSWVFVFWCAWDAAKCARQSDEVK